LKIEIFVSYCHEDVRPDDARMKVLIEAIDAAGKGTYDIVVDYRHQGAAIGSNLDAFVRRIDTCDVVIVLLTPGYKSRVAAKSGHVVYDEFRRIHDRYVHTSENGTYGRSFLLLPIVFTATFAEACPPEFEKTVCGDLEWLHVVPPGKGRRPLTVRRGVRSLIDQFVTDLSARIAALAVTRKTAFSREQEVVFQSFLFEDTKSRWDDPANRRYYDTAFVKTSSFLKARDRAVSFLVGRKGAGKSTITHALPIQSTPPPATVVRLEFETLPFELCYNVLRSSPGEASDLRRAFSPVFSYQLLWDGFLHLCLAWAVHQRLPRRSWLRTRLQKLVAEPVAEAENALERERTVTRVLFVYAFEQLVAFLRRAVMSPGRETGLSSAVARFTASGFRRHLLGGKGIVDLGQVIEAYDRAGERVLVTADGFDVVRGYWTKESEEAPDATRFERELLLGLFQVVLGKGPAHGGLVKYYKITDFCVAIPHDRFLHVRKLDRDRYRYRHRFASIAWTGIELSALVRKRLALLKGVADPSGAPLEERLAAVMRKGFRELPEELIFQFGSGQYRMPLFLYVLRHTFWRPRDVLFYYAGLLVAASQFPRKEPMPTAFVRQIVAVSTRRIVEDEFLDEFAVSIRNLREIVRQFREGPQVLDVEEVRRRIEELRFETDLPPGESASLEWKIELLYDIGFLGVVVDRRTSERLSVCRHAFSFNEGDLLPERLGRDKYGSLQYLVHPVFCEYLHLDTTANQELTLNMDWEYLHRNERLRCGMSL
jgi:hypothetical protein